MGNLTRDPDYKQLTSGQAVCRLGLASNRSFKNRQTGDMVQEVCFVDVDVWGAQAESCKQYLEKGRAVLIEGRLKLDSWEDAEGQKRSKHSIVADRVTFLASSQDTSSFGQADQSENSSSTNSSNDSNNFESKKMETKTKPVSEKKSTGKVTEEPNNSGEVNFADEKPFEDDLPF